MRAGLNAKNLVVYHENKLYSVSLLTSGQSFKQSTQVKRVQTA